MNVDTVNALTTRADTVRTEPDPMRAVRYMRQLRELTQ